MGSGQYGRIPIATYLSFTYSFAGVTRVYGVDRVKEGGRDGKILKKKKAFPPRHNYITLQLSWTITGVLANAFQVILCRYTVKKG
jgi:hypothetical protein